MTDDGGRTALRSTQRRPLLWINGPFGVGKTQTAFELHRRLPGSVVCDPEHVGIGLNRMVPPGPRGDFQDFPAWRQGVYEVLDRVLSVPGGVVIVPMTVADPGYFREIVGRLRDDGRDVRHFALIAEPATVRARLSGRELPFRAPDAFALDRVDRYLESLSRSEFAEHIRTDGLSVTGVVELIADAAGLVLEPDTDGRLRARLRRAQVTISHIRLW